MSVVCFLGTSLFNKRDMVSTHTPLDGTKKIMRLFETTPLLCGRLKRPHRGNVGKCWYYSAIKGCPLKGRPFYVVSCFRTLYTHMVYSFPSKAFKPVGSRHTTALFSLVTAFSFYPIFSMFR